MMARYIVTPLLSGLLTLSRAGFWMSLGSKDVAFHGREQQSGSRPGWVRRMEQRA